MVSSKFLSACLVEECPPTPSDARPRLRKAPRRRQARLVSNTAVAEAAPTRPSDRPGQNCHDATRQQQGNKSRDYAHTGGCGATRPPFPSSGSWRGDAFSLLLGDTVRWRGDGRTSVGPGGPGEVFFFRSV